MSRLVLRARSLTLVLVASSLVASLAYADPSQNDGGSGGDASPSLATATPLPGLGSYAGSLWENDTDAYAVATDSSQPSCVSFSLAPSVGVDAAVQVQGASGNKTARFSLAGGATQSGGIAANAARAAKLAVASQAYGTRETNDKLFGYGFSLGQSFAASGLSATLRGHSIADANPLQGPCTVGKLSLLYGNDFYSLGTVDAGKQVVLSVASTGGSAVAQLYDSAGNAIPATSTSGTMSTYSVPTSGTYYVGVVRADGGVGDVTYLVGSIVTEPPGAGCRPNC